MFYLGGAESGCLDEDVDHGDDDLRFFFAGCDCGGEEADDDRGDDEQGGEFAVLKRGGDGTRCAEFAALVAAALDGVGVLVVGYCGGVEVVFAHHCTTFAG